MKRKFILIYFAVIGAMIGGLVGHETAKNKYVEKSEAETIIKEINPRPVREAPSSKGAYIKKAVAKKIFSPRIKSFSSKQLISAKETPAVADLSLQYWADKEVIDNIRFKEPFSPGDEINLLIQTYEPASAGATYAFSNFDFLPKPLKLRSGLYAYINRYNPPAAAISPRGSDKFIIVTAANQETLLKALNYLEVP